MHKGHQHTTRYHKHCSAQPESNDYTSLNSLLPLSRGPIPTFDAKPYQARWHAIRLSIADEWFDAIIVQ